MKYIQIKNNIKKALVDDEDYDRISVFKWYCGGNGDNIYRYNPKNRKGFSNMSNEVLNIDSLIDHKDRNSFNNQKDNLRSATQSQNSANKERAFWSKSIY